MTPGAPSTAAVVQARYADAVDLDDGGLLVTPPPNGAKATVTESEANAMFDATDAVQGPHEFAILGLGVVTVAPRTEEPTTTTPTTTAPSPSTAPATTTLPPPPPTTAPRPTTTTPPPTTTTTTTTTTVPPAPTTTASALPSSRAPTTRARPENQARLVADESPDGPPPLSSRLVATPPSTTVAPTTVAPTTTPVPTTPPTTTTTLPTYHHRLAWVGIAWGASVTCGATTTTQPSTGTATSYVAVVIDARAAHRVIAYRSAGMSPCSGTPAPPSVFEPDELLSVPWQPVGPSSTAVQIQVPACGHYFGWTQVPAAGGVLADQVVVAVPFDPNCGSTASESQPVDQVVPLGAGQAQVAHAPVGPIQALQALPND